MGNHYHLLLETPEPNLVAGMKWLQGTYTQRFNALFSQRGHLFQGRYKAHPVQTEEGLNYFRQVSTYIHLNPFRAKMAGEGCKQSLSDYRWSSFPAYTRSRVRTPCWLTRKKVLKTWGLPDVSPSTLKTYEQKLHRLMKFKNDPDAGRRGEFETQMKRGWYLGGEAFCAKLLDRLSHQEGVLDSEGPQRRDSGTIQAVRLLQKALTTLNLSEAELKTRKAVDIEKQAVVWLIKMNSTVTLQWIADRLDMGNRVNASRAIARFREKESKAVEILKQKMYQCTA
jgi:hypothetical protein